MERTTVPVANLTDIKNKEYLTLRDITPQWFERLNKILNENDKGIIHSYTLKSMIIKDA